MPTSKLSEKTLDDFAKKYGVDSPRDNMSFVITYPLTPEQPIYLDSQSLVVKNHSASKTEFSNIMAQTLAYSLPNETFQMMQLFKDTNGRPWLSQNSMPKARAFMAIAMALGLLPPTKTKGTYSKVPSVKNIIEQRALC